MLQRELGEIFQREAKSYFGGAMITVTKVSVTSDLSLARVFLSVFAASDKASMVDLARKRSSEIRFNLGKKIKNQVRHIPNLEFFEDDSLDYIENINKLLHDV